MAGTTGSAEQRLTPPHGVRRPLVASAVTVVLLTVALAVLGLVVAAEQRASPPNCYGIGWGCQPDPKSTVGLAAMILALPAATVTLTAVWVGWWLTRRESTTVNRASVWAGPVLLTVVCVSWTTALFVG